jgi:hypothetical protein
MIDFNDRRFNPMAAITQTPDLWDLDTINIAARGDLQILIDQHFNNDNAEMPNAELLQDWAKQLDQRWGALLDALERRSGLD